MPLTLLPAAVSPPRAGLLPPGAAWWWVVGTRGPSHVNFFPPFPERPSIFRDHLHDPDRIPLDQLEIVESTVVPLVQIFTIEVESEEAPSWDPEAVPRKSSFIRELLEELSHCRRVWPRLLHL